MKKTIPIIILAVFAFYNACAQKEWTGATSKAWNVASNWNPSGVPVAGDNVVIPSAPANQPEINGLSTAVCNNLVINAGASLTLAATSSSDANLTLGGNANFYGTFIIKGYFSLVPPITRHATLSVSDMNWHSGSSITTTLYSTIQVSGNWSFFSGSAVDMNLCNVSFTGSTNSNLNSYSANSRFNSLAINKTGGAQLIINASSTATLGIDGTLTIGSGAVLTGSAAITTLLEGNLINSGNFYFNAGTVSLERASATQTIQVNSGNYFNNLTINAGETVTVNNNLEVKGNLLIQAGVFDPQNNTLSVGGNWTNNVGTAAFTEGSGRVIFNGGNYHQYCSNETFNTLEVNKPLGGALRASGTTVICAKYDWTAGAVDVLSNGTFTANQLLDDGIAGNFYINTGCTINLYNYTGNIDMKGNLYIYGGNFKVYGGINPSWWPSGGNASITMSGGVLDFVDQSIVVKTDATYSFTQNIAGGTIRTAKNFSNGRADFTPSAGTIELYGSTESYLLMTTGNLYALKINKTVGTVVNLDANATINGGIDVFSGTFRVNNKVLTTNESVVVNNGGTLWMDLNSQLKIGGSKTLNVNSGGTLRVIGTSGNEAVITRNGSSGYYVINISSGGTVAAKYASFYYVDPIRVYSGATIEAANPFSYCKFRYAQFGMLRIDNSQNLLIRNVEFLTPATGYNVYKSVNSGSLEFKDAYGDYSGATYENDPYNRINWTVTQPGLWTGAVSTSWSTSENWDDFTVPVAGTHVTIPASASYMPVLDVGTWQCNNLTVNGTITLAGANLTANGNLTVNGTLAMNNASSQFTVLGDVAWNSGSQANITANGLILVNGHWNFNEGSNAQLNNGSVYFQGTASKWIRCYSANSIFYSVYVTKTGGAQAGFSDLSTQPMVIKGELRIFANGKFVSDGLQDVILHGNLTCDGTLQCNDGAFKLDGATQSLKPNTSDYFNHLVFSQTGTASINTANTSILNVKGNLHIDSGVFNAGNCTINVEGNWDNNVGPAAFTEGGSRVVFKGGNYHQYITNSEDFATLEVNKPSGGALRVSNSSAVTAISYDWTAGALDMISGSFTATYLQDDGVAGNFYINSGTTVTLGNMSSYYHLKGNLYLYGGTLNVIAPAAMQWPGNGNASITMSVGGINVYPYGIEIVNNPPYTFTTNITGGTIMTEGTFVNHRSDFTPAGGTVELYGSNNTSITMNAGSLNGLTINKPSDKTVTLTTNATVNGLLTVESGTLKVSNKVLTTGHNIAVNNGGILWMDLNSQLKIASGKFLDVNAGGLLKTIGSAGNEVVFTINGTGYYYIYINGTGSISARQTSFYYVNPVLVGSSATIDPVHPFDYCKFRYSATEMLKVLNSQDLLIKNVEFLTPAAGYNVIKLNNSGSLTFRDSYGDFSGPAFENDPNNRIHWTYTQPGLWTGAVSSSWYSGDNWDDGLVPGPGTNVTIPASAPFMPVLDAGIWECNNLTINGTLTIAGANLTANGNMTVSGTLAMNAAADQLTILGDVVWNLGSQANITADANILVSGHWNFNEGSNAQINNGTVRFSGTVNKNITNHSTIASFYNLAVNKTSNAVINFTSGSTQSLKINGTLSIGANAKFTSSCDQEIVLKQDLISNGVFQCNSGTFRFNGIDQSVTHQLSDYFNNITFNQSGTVSFDWNFGVLVIKGNLTIQSGVFQTFVSYIYIGGNWDNQIGPGAFIDYMDCHVCFNGGNYHQYCSNETFYWLELDKPLGGALRVNGTTVTCSKYQWIAGAVDVLNSGVFNVTEELIDDGIAGNFYLNSGCIINLYNYNGNVGLQGNLYIYGGNFNVYGGTNPSSWPEFSNASITMSGGVLNFADQSISIVNHPYSTFSQNITGGTIRTSKNFANERTNFTPTGGTIEMYGSTDAYVLFTAGNLHSLRIDKNTGNTVNVNSDLTINGQLTVNSGTLRVNNKILTTAQNIEVNNGGTLWMDLNSQLKIAATKALTVNNGGWLKAIGSEGNECVITRNGASGYFYIDIFGGGTIAAQRASFYYVNPLRVYSGATIDTPNAFRWCKFRYCATGMLRIDNSQDLVLRNIEFLTPAAGYNVAKMVNSGTVSLKDSYGDYSGATYENDTYNRIHWSASQPGLWTGVVSNNWLDPDNWDDLNLPNSSTDVVIPASAPNMPVLNVEQLQVWVNHLTVLGTLTIGESYLGVNSDCYISGSLILNSQLNQPMTGTLNVGNDLIWESGSTASLSANSSIIFYRNVVFNAGSNVQILEGKFGCVSYKTTQLVNHSSNTFINRLLISKDTDVFAIFSDASTQDLYVNYLELLGGHFSTAGNKSFVLHKNIINTAGQISCTSGKFKLGGVNQSLLLRPDDYFYRLAFSQTGTASINTANTSVLTVKEHLSINSGVFDATNLTIKIAGSWNNIVGPAAFIETGSRVIFNGEGYQTMTQSESFDTLEINKPGKLYLYFCQVECNVYDWTSGGLELEYAADFSAYGLADDAIKGIFSIYPDCSINIYPGEGKYNLEASCYIYGGNFNVYGYSYSPMTSNWGVNSACSLTMTEGVLDFNNISIKIGGAFNGNITGGRIRTKRDFKAFNFNPTGGGVEIYGSGTSWVDGMSGSFYSLIIDKASEYDGVNGLYIEVKNNFIVNKGKFFILTINFECWGNINVGDGGTLWLGLADVLLKNNSKINIWQNGTLIADDVNSEIRGITSGDYFSINAHSGSTVQVKNIKCRQLTDQGFYIAPGAYVDPDYSFDGCRFEDGKPGLNAYLTIDNDQDIVIRNAFFDENTSGVLYNVAKTVNAGSVTFKDASGAFAGEAFENDPYNRIHWVASQPGLWTGALSTNWHEPGNWDDLQVPSADMDVTIPATAPFMPVISDEDTECNYLLLYGTLTIGNKTLYVNGQANIHGSLVMTHNDGVLKAMSDIYWHAGSTANVSGNATIEAWAGWFFLEGSNVQLNSGVVRFYGTSYNPISIESPDSYFNMLFIQRTDGGGLAFSNSSTADLKTVLFIVVEGSIFTSFTSQNVVVSGVYNTAGTTQLHSGSLVFAGNDISWVPGTNSFEFNVVFSQAGNVTINTANSEVLDIRGSVTINSGVFMPGNCTIKVGGHWNNNVGPAAFDEGTSRVIFNGTVPQTVRNEEFYILELDKSPGMPFSIGTGTVVSCQVFDWTNGRLNTQTGATFNAYDLADDGVYGLFSTGSSGTINLYQDGNQSVNILGALTINGGTFNIYGGNDQCGMGYAGSTELNMTSGVLDIKNQSIYIIDNYPWVFQGIITGGTIRSSGGFTAQSPGFVPDGGTVEVYGEGVGFLFAELGASFYNVKINKPYSYYNTPHHITILTSLIRNDFTIESGSARLLSDKVLYCLGDVTVKDGGVMQISAADLLMKNEKNLLIEAGGILGISGQPDRYAKIAGFTTEDYYAFNVAGELSCYYGWISQINEQGIYIPPGGTMSAYFLELLDGEPGSNPLITVNSENMMTLRAVNFPANNWGGQYNIRKINDAGMVFMLDATGPFSGEAYEYDPYNRVYWMPHTNNTAPQTVNDGITICENAFSFLNVADLVVESGGSADLIAGVRISILPGTHIKDGGRMHAWITQTFEFCEQQQSMLASTEIAQSEPLQDNYSLPELAADNQQLSIYPNPTRGTFTIELSGFENSRDVAIQIFGMRGEQIHSLELANPQQYVVDASTWQPGVYIIRVLAGNEHHYTKVIKQ